MKTQNHRIKSIASSDYYEKKNVYVLQSRNILLQNLLVFVILYRWLQLQIQTTE